MNPFDWSGYLALADELASRTGDEAAERSAISRAYYAALGRASGLLKAEGRAISPFKTHSMVWRAFKHSGDPARETIGMDLDELRRLRDRADYTEVFEGDLSDAARDAVMRARRLLESLDAITAALDQTPSAD